MLRILKKMSGVEAIDKLSVEPSYPTQGKTVLYYWKQCGHCQNLFETYATLAKQYPSMVAIDVFKHRTAILRGGAVTMSGVPHVVAYSKNNKAYVIPPSEVALRPAAGSGRKACAAGDGLIVRGQLQNRSVAPWEVKPGTLVLYYSHECPYCKAFAPEYLKLSPRQAVAINTKEYPDAQQWLDVEARSRTVPHVVYHDSVAGQHAYSGERTAQALQDFITTHESDKGKESLRGGSSECDAGSGPGPSQELDVITVNPGDVQGDSVVLYFDHECPHCQRFAPIYSQLPATLQAAGINTHVVAVDTAVSVGVMQQLQEGAQAPGVPHVVYHSKSGAQLPFVGDRTLVELVKFVRQQKQQPTASLLGGGGGEQEADVDLAALEISPERNKGPAVVLYFYHECPYCKAFAPEVLKFANQLRLTKSPVNVFAVNIKTHKGVLQALDAPPRGVPHVVYFNEALQQTPYKGERTVQGLLRFVVEQTPEPKSLQGGAKTCSETSTQEELKDRQVHFAAEPVAPIESSNLETARQNLRQQAADLFGEDSRDLFEPENAGVCFIGLACSATSPKRDRVYVVIIPKVDITGEGFPVLAVMYGQRNGKLTTAVYTDKNPVTLLERKRHAGYERVRTTHPLAEKFHNMGYAIRVQDGKQSRVLMRT